MARKGEGVSERKRWIPEESRSHLRAAGREWLASIEALLPSGFVEHSRAARREMLLAARSLIDDALTRIEKREGD